MAVQEIVLMGDPRLREKSKPIPEQEIQTDDIQMLIADMVATASQTPENGFITAGLAAPQVGVLKRLFLVIKDGSDKSNPQYDVYINSDIDIENAEVVDSEESCLSTPHLCGVVKRYKELRVTYLDAEGKRQRKKVSGDQAIFMQHENDHLDGILWVDKQMDTRLMSYC